MDIKAITTTRNTTLIEIANSVIVVVMAAVLAYLGCVRVQDGMAIDRAIPVPTAMVARIALPKAAYVDAAAALARANLRDGIALQTEAEAMLSAGYPNETVISKLEVGLAGAPASARGWMLLSDARYAGNKAASARALSMAMSLASQDYWLIGTQVREAARLWSELDNDTRRTARTEARLLWQEPRLRPDLHALVDAPGGALLLSQSLSPNDIRALNRWLARDVRRQAAP